RFRASGQQYAKRLRGICAREQFQEMSAFRIDPLEVFDQHERWPIERQCQEGIDERARNLRLRRVAQSLARARFSNVEQGFNRPAIAYLEVEFRERLAKLGVRREVACSEQFSHQGKSGSKRGNTPLCGAIKDAASRVRRQRVGHRGRCKTALANSWFADHGDGSALAAGSRKPFAERSKLVRAADN